MPGGNVSWKGINGKGWAAFRFSYFGLAAHPFPLNSPPVLIMSKENKRTQKHKPRLLPWVMTFKAIMLVNLHFCCWHLAKTPLIPQVWRDTRRISRFSSDRGANLVKTSVETPPNLSPFSSNPPPLVCISRHFGGTARLSELSSRCFPGRSQDMGAKNLTVGDKWQGLL